MILTATIRNEAGEVLGLIPLASKDFKTGSRGYFGQGKVVATGERLQVQVQAVVIGSKPAVAKPQGEEPGVQTG